MLLGTSKRDSRCFYPKGLLFFAFTFLLSGKQVFGQKMIGGKVETQRGEIVPYATIVLSKDSSVVVNAISDSLGRFYIEIPDLQEQCFIQAFFLGLKSLKSKIDIKNSQSYLLTIRDSSNQLSKIVVSGSKPMFVSKSDRFVFTPNKLLAEGSSAIDILRHTPMIQYSDKDDAINIISKSSTIIYINNRKSNLPREMIIQMLRSLPAENIMNIEIITNPGSEYASNTLGGIININIKRQADEGWLGNVSIQTQQSSYNSSFVNGSFNYRKNKLAIQFIPALSSNYNFNTTKDLFLYKYGDNNSINNYHYRRYYVAGGGLNIEFDLNRRSSISFSGWFSHVNGKSTTNATTTLLQDSISKRDSSEFSTSKGNDTYTYNFGNFNYHFLFDSLGKSFMDVNVDYNHFDQQRAYDGQFYGPNSDSVNLAYYNVLPQHFLNLSERVDLTFPVWKNVILNTGVQFSSTRVRDPLQYFNVEAKNLVPDTAQDNNYRYNENYWGGFVTLSTPINKKWDANIGLRYEHTKYTTEELDRSIKYDSSYKNLFPSFGLSFSPDPKNHLGISITRKIIRPDIESLFPGIVYYTKTYFKENNPFLQPSLVYNFQFGYSHGYNFSFLVNYSYSRNAFSNFILPAYTADSVINSKSTIINYGNQSSLTGTFYLYEPVVKNVWEIYFTPSFNYSLYNASNPLIASRKVNYSFSIYYDNYIYLTKKRDWMAFLTFKLNSPVRTISQSTSNYISSLDFEVKKTIKRFSYYIIFTDLYNGSSLTRNFQLPNPVATEQFSETNTYNRSILFKVKYNFGNNKLRVNRVHQTANEEIRKRSS